MLSSNLTAGFTTRDGGRPAHVLGAVATGATLEIVEDIAYRDMRHDEEMGALYLKHAESLGRVFTKPTSPVSTDMGNISYEVPSIHPMVGIETHGAVNHQKAFADACVESSADQAIFDGAICMALTAIDVARDERIKGCLLG